jgi:hypothetical protein
VLSFAAPIIKILEDLMQRYDVPTAVTFLFAGLGLGAVLAILLAPRSGGRRWIRGLQPERRFDEFDEEEVLVGPAV